MKKFTVIENATIECGTYETYVKALSAVSEELKHYNNLLYEIQVSDIEDEMTTIFYYDSNLKDNFLMVCADCSPDWFVRMAIAGDVKAIKDMFIDDMKYYCYSNSDYELADIMGDCFNQELLDELESTTNHLIKQIKNQDVDVNFSVDDYIEIYKNGTDWVDDLVNIADESKNQI